MVEASPHPCTFLLGRNICKCPQILIFKSYYSLEAARKALSIFSDFLNFIPDKGKLIGRYLSHPGDSDIKLLIGTVNLEKVAL